MAAAKKGEITCRAWSDWKGGHWLVRAVVMPLLGLAVGLAAGPILGQILGWRVTDPVVTGLIGAIGAPLIWAVLTFLGTLLRTPYRLLAEKNALIATRDAQIRDLTLGLRPIFDGDIGYGPGRERPTGSSSLPNGVSADLEIKQDQKEAQEVRVYASAAVRRASGSIGEESVSCQMVGQACAVYSPPGLLSKGTILKIILLTKEPVRLARVRLLRAGSDEDY